MGYWTRLSLLQRFTLISAGIAIALAVAMSAVAVRVIQDVVIRDEAQVAGELVLHAVSPLFRAADFSGAFPPERRALLDSLFRAHGVSDKILRIRLWRADGVLLYSNTEEPEAPRSPGTNLAVPAGYRTFFLSEESRRAAPPSVARFVVPIQIAGEDKILGAFEIFYDLTAVRRGLAHVRRIAWTTIPVGIAVLYASVFVLVRRTSRQLLKQQADLIAAHLGTYSALATAIDAKDSSTGDHSARVSDLAVRLATAMKLPADMVDDIRVGARLHDVGKIGTPDAILGKRGPLSPEELAQMREHATLGVAILDKAPVSARVRQAVRHAHERWDGTGYPDRLAGAAIPLPARITAVVDAYEAMTSTRPYHQGIPSSAALERLRASSGSHFDPEVVEAFLRLMGHP